MTKLKQNEGAAALKVCRVCGKAKPLKDFYAHQGNTCKECTKKRSNRVDYTPARMQSISASRRISRLKRRYKMSPVRIIAMLSDQDWRCRVCEVPVFYPGVTEPQGDGAVRCVVDHSHRDGHVRGMLCSACNSAIGLFDDNLKWIKAAYFYLKNDLSSSRISGGS